MSDLAAYANIINAHTGIIFATFEFEDGVTLDEAAAAVYRFIDAEVDPQVACTIEIQQKGEE